MIRQNKNKGFTLVEMLVAVAIMIAVATLSISTISAIGSAKLRSNTETFKSTIEAAREYSTAHGGNTFVSVIKTQNGLQIVETSTAARKDDGTRVDKNINEVNLNDKAMNVYYKLVGDATEYQLGKSDADCVNNGTLQFQFSSLTGGFVGSYYVDSMRFENSNKDYTLLFSVKTGAMAFDYESDADKIVNKPGAESSKSIEMPTFVVGGKAYATYSMPFNDKIQQPELAYDSRYVSISGIYRAKDVNEDPGYKIVFSLKDPYTTKWADGQIYDYVLTWYITQT